MAFRTLPTLPTVILIMVFVESEDVMNLALTCHTLNTVWKEDKEDIVLRRTRCYNMGRGLAIFQSVITSSTPTMENLHVLRSKKLSQQPSLINIIHANTADATALVTAIEHSLLPKRLTCTRPDCRNRSTTLTTKEKECITLAHHLLRAYVLLRGWGMSLAIHPLRESFEALIASLGSFERELLRTVFMFILDEAGANEVQIPSVVTVCDYRYRIDTSDRLFCLMVQLELSRLLEDTAAALCGCETEAILGGREVLLPTSFLDGCLG